MAEEKVTVGEVLTFYKKYKEKIWAIVGVLIGLFGGNADRVDQFVPLRGNGIEARVSVLEEKLNSCCDKNPSVVVEVPDVRVK